MVEKKEEKEEKEKIDKSLKLSIAEGSSYAVMDGVGNAYISPFAIAMNASNAQIAALTSIPSLVAPFFQLKTASILEKVGSRKKIILANIFMHSFLWLPILLIPFLFLKNGPLILIILFSLAVIVSSFINPVWMSWMGDIVPEDQRGRYFGKRSEIIGLVGLISMLLAGFFLDLFPKNEVFIGFAILFIIAIIARLFSGVLFARIYEPKLIIKKEFEFGFIDFIKKMWTTNFGRYTIYMMLIYLVVMIASPFFTVYLLRELKFSYTIYTIINVFSALASLFSMPLWGKIADRFGNVKVMRLTGLLIPLVPILFIFSPNQYYLMVIQTYSGFVWAGFGLSSGNFVFDAVGREKRAVCVSYLNILSGVGIFIGASIGGYLATNLDIGFMNIFLFIFLVSAILRFGVSASMLPLIKEERKVDEKPLYSIIGLKLNNIAHGFHHHMLHDITEKKDDKPK